mmetsp:Transcript_19356/g.37655  ORF Transcript_19356/g.37655 Transcript_19356/m.37655 type:complete len:238 (+) Transcript_19356:429-1142(+)
MSSRFIAAASASESSPGKEGRPFAATRPPPVSGRLRAANVMKRLPSSKTMARDIRGVSSMSAGTVAPSYPLSCLVFMPMLCDDISSLISLTARVLACFRRQSTALAPETSRARVSYETAMGRECESTTMGAGFCVGCAWIYSRVAFASSLLTTNSRSLMVRDPSCGKSTERWCSFGTFVEICCSRCRSLGCVFGANSPSPITTTIKLTGKCRGDPPDAGCHDDDSMAGRVLGACTAT